MPDATPVPIFADSTFTLEQADFCDLPGYLILRPVSAVRSLSELSADEASRLGVLLSAAVAALEAVAAAERVHVLSFCEVDWRLHFHLLPRSEALRRAYQDATGTTGAPVDGARLFDWTRATFPAGASLPADFPDAHAVGVGLRERLAAAR